MAHSLIDLASTLSVPRAVTPAARPPAPWRVWGWYVAKRLIVPVCLLILWQLATVLAPTPSLPSPGVVLDSWYIWVFGPVRALQWYSGTWLYFGLLSLRRVGAGFAIASVCGVSFGLLLGWYATVSDLFDGMINFLRAIPTTAWIPFAVFFFGIHESAAIFLIAFGSFFPIVTNVASGARQTPRTLIRAALMLGTRRHKLLLRVVLPSALPAVLTGLRVGLGLSWVLVIVSEMLAVQGGLGYALWSAYQFNRLDLIVTAIISVGTFGLLSDWALGRAGAWTLRWQRGLTGA
jgi:NitT/TauT family transport system permease protein